MRRLRSRILWACLAGLSAQGISAQQNGEALRLSVLMASDYKLSGLSQTGSDPAVRFSADYEHRSGLFTGGSIGNVDYAADTNLLSPRNTSANLYLGFLWRGSHWAGTVSAARYVYPDASRYDYTQAAAGFSYRNRYFFSYTRSNDYFSLGQSAHQYRAGVSLPWIWGLQTSLNGGKLRSDELFEIAYSFWDIGLSKLVGRFALDLRYHEDTYDRSTPLGETGDDRWVFSVSYAISPRARAQDRDRPAPGRRSPP